MEKENIMENIHGKEKNLMPEDIEAKKRPFVIDDDKKADWAMRTIAQIDAEVESWQQHYERQMEKLRKEADFKKALLTEKLKMYFETVPHHVTKTQESYQLKSGKMVLKYQEPKCEKDTDTLLKWMKENEHQDLIQTKEEVKWGELKKRLTITAYGAYDKETGVVVNGLTFTERPPKMEFVMEKEQGSEEEETYAV